MSPDLSRREFMLVGTTSLLSLNGNVQQKSNLSVQNDQYQFDGVADLMGPADAKPAPDDPFFENKVAYAYRYQATDSGARYFIEDGDNTWDKLNIFVDEADVTGRINFPIQNPADNGVNGNRSEGTWYQNTTGNLLIVNVMWELSAASSGTDVIRAQVEVNDKLDNQRVTGRGATSNTSQHGWTGLSMWVPDGLYYQLRSFGDTGNLNIIEWREVETT